MDWFNTTVRAELDRHIALVGPRRVAVVASPAARQRYAPALDPLLSEGRIAIADTDAISGESVAVVVVIGDTLAQARQLHARLTAAKDAGLPVVYCMPDRRLALQAPGWENTGLSYAGMFKIAANYLASLSTKGDYLEFGVFDGHTLILAYHTMRDVCATFHAFDSFRGIGGTRPEERTHFKDGQYYANVETLDYNLQFAGVDQSRVRTVAGFFEDTIEHRHPSDFGISAATVVHIDTDVLEPALLALEFVSPVLHQGTLLLFDDYDQFDASNQKGERAAVKTWLASHPEFEIEPYRQYGSVCRSFLVHRRDGAMST